MFKLNDPMQYYTYGSNSTYFIFSTKKHDREIGFIFGKEPVKERFNGKRMYYKAGSLIAKEYAKY